MITIGSQNNAPTSHHKTHDVYIFHIDLSRPDKPLCFEQSIGGGHCEQGGAIWLAVSELEGWAGDWREHLDKSGCTWVAEILDAHPNADQPTLVSMILNQHAKPASRWRAIANGFKRNVSVTGRYGV